MDLGLGLPAVVPGVPASTLADWAPAVEAAGFAGTAVLDRIAYPSYDPLVTLAMVAARTTRLRMTTTALLAPARGPAAVLAKQAMSLSQLAGGRFTLGMAIGARPEDYQASGVPFGDRGRRMERLIGELRSNWRSGPPGEPPALLLGGHSDRAVHRAARLADGWICGGTSRQGYHEHAERARKAWADAGRSGPPRLVALRFFALGPEADDSVRATMGAFYANTGPYLAQAIAGTLSDPAAVRAVVAEHRDAGCDELIFMPCSAAPDQVNRLADAVLA
ncbi:MAG TPA: LLM class flavin-dependent oxidoreductase [Streptosporangiaceae bacterium]|jgi:alkanesulfonate monooxygenase SsuD/methylene tetrahydromethanopterin reductase-like flavin-dependent oxidoreductase (luciferase family)|nr:LLM class flavin-dependent oxidoreductase [Streptosporangiaceae bacterium]